ncbi:MAG: DUF5674 family protein [Parcubacteria group bacterium]
METRIVKEKITRARLKVLAPVEWGGLIKAAVDLEQEIIGVGGEFHSEIEAKLITEEHSLRENTWGINLDLNQSKESESFVEFDSMINLKPLLGNKSRDVLNPETRKRIKIIIDRLISD